MQGLFSHLDAVLQGGDAGPGPDVNVGPILAHLLLAAALSVAVCYRPWRLVMRHPARIHRETADTQVLVAVAGAIMMAVIGNNVARAFGLVGLGGLVRFRSSIQDTRDAALMFMTIAIGMACGVGLLGMAVTIALVSAIGLAVFDFTDRSVLRRVSVRVDEPRAALVALRAAFPQARVIAAPFTKTMGAGANTVVLDLNGEAGESDAAALLDLVKARGVPGVRSVSIDEE